jgi:pimeloyl-ACP methyl ester carboxylesterase
MIQVPVSGRSIDVAVWYPTAADPTHQGYGTANVAGQAAVDAPVKPGPWPLLVFSHGYSGSGVGSASIAELVAASGYVVAAPDHGDKVTEVRIRAKPTGNIRHALEDLGRTPPSLESHGYRPAEVRAVMDVLLGSEEFSVHPRQVALAGHSLGGWTAINTALRDPRPRALVLYSMGELHWLMSKQRFFGPDELARLGVPVFYFYGSREADAVEDRGSVNARFAYQHTKAPACIVEVKGGNHFVYVSKAVAPRSGGNALQLRRIAQATVSFLDRVLKGEGSAVMAEECRGL